MSVKRVIIEGPDCSGKSTIVDRLKNRLRWDSKSLHHMDGDQFKRYLKEYANQEQIVFDRSHISEIVYSKLWRGGTPFSKEEQNILNSITKLNTIIILVCPTLNIIKKRYLSRKFNQQIKLDELLKSRNLFLNSFKNFTHIRYNAESYEELEKLITRIEAMIK